MQVERQHCNSLCRGPLFDQPRVWNPAFLAITVVLGLITAWTIVSLSEPVSSPDENQDEVEHA